MVPPVKAPADEPIMDTPGLARYLRVSERTIASRLDEIPHFRVGKQIRFYRDAIIAWIEKQHLARSSATKTGCPPQDPDRLAATISETPQGLGPCDASNR